MKKAAESLWLETAPHPSFPPIAADTTADVCIVGGGIAGITAAYRLHAAGKQVVLLEAGKVGNGVTGFTTAHLTEALDTRWYALTKHFGKERARLAAQAQRAAIDEIARVADAERIGCSFARVPGTLYSETSPDEIVREFEAAQSLGMQVELHDSAALPFKTVKALTFANQAQFHPLRYLIPLAQRLAEGGVRIYEQSRVVEVKDGEPCVVRTEHGAVRASAVLVCTHTPVNDRFFLHTKLAQYRSYVVTARNVAPIAGLFWDDADPYHYLRMHDDVLIVGGEDHKVGQKADTGEPYARLADYVRSRFPGATIGDEWSAQVVETIDGLPYIGRNALEHHVFVATGFSGNGMTNGTAAGILLADLALGRPNPWADVFTATRIKPSGAAEWVKENVDYPFHLLVDRLKPADAKALEQVPRGEGRIVAVDGKKVAAYREDDGRLRAFSAVCTHMACLVHWNPAEKSWDCPCHGARFDTEGEVINGPAPTPLKKL